MALRVLQVTPYFAPAFRYGGPPRSILGLSRALLRNGVEVEVFTTTANGTDCLPASQEMGTDVEGVLTWRFPLRFPRHSFGAAGMQRALEKAMHRFDVLHVHGLWNIPAYLGASQARKLGIPYVISPRGMLERAALQIGRIRKRLAFQMIERHSLQRAGSLHATSDREAETLRSLLPDSSVFMLPNGIEIPGASLVPRGDVRKRLGIGNAAPLILFLGRLHQIKRLDLVVGAFKLVRKRHPGAILVLAGPSEPAYAETLRQLLVQVQGVCLAGPVDHDTKWGLLADADVVVLCSDSESFGISVAESLAAGTPVVVTRTCPWEVLETLRVGYWVSQDVQSIADGILRLIDNPEGREMERRARTFAESRFDWDIIARQMIAQYMLLTHSSPN